MSDAASVYVEALEALAGIHSAEAIAHRAEAARLSDLAEQAKAHHREPHLTAVVTFRMRGAFRASDRATAEALAAEACIAGAEALRSMPRAAPPSP